MCGINGIYDLTHNQDKRANLLKKMALTMEHRGPDDEGLYLSERFTYGCSFKRLSIIDPEHGHQPMISACGRFVLVFNGAIYNYLELRRELISLGQKIHSYSDTEVILHAYMAWGEGCLERLRGMFAFAIWDNDSGELFCARDRVGIKPFYYYFDEERFVFSSEIKSMISTGLIESQLDRDALKDYLVFQFCLGNKTLFKNIFKLEPGWCLKIKKVSQRLEIKTSQYWDLVDKQNAIHSEQYYIDHLSALLDESINLHLRSDVTLGAHLSGGLDSSTIVTYSSNFLDGARMDTFTGAFNAPGAYDETQYARIVSQNSNTNYHEIYIEPDNFEKTMRDIIYSMDEPLAGPGVIPQYFVSQYASKHVKVTLGGQGGDEIFMGYARYLIASLEDCLYREINGTPANDLNLNALNHLQVLKQYLPLIRNTWQKSLFKGIDHTYFNLIDRSSGILPYFDKEIFNNHYNVFEAFQQVFNKLEHTSTVNKMSYFDIKASLPALLHVEDRTSMAASLESRVPLLDHKLLEFVFNIPSSIKFKNGDLKYLLKRVVENKVPSEIVQRNDKMGFPVPLQHWFKGKAGEFVKDTLHSTAAKNRGLYNLDNMKDLYNSKDEFSRVTWGILCFELWSQTFLD